IYGGKLSLDYHNNGRPFIQNSNSQISISHTSRFVSIITHSQEIVGIDIEMLNRNFSAVEKKALSSEEIENLSDLDRDLHLAIHWSAKEAIFKRVSCLGVDFAKQIFIKKFTPQKSGQLTAIFLDKAGEEQEFHLNYEILEDHIMAWLVG
ncbi:MAG: 4'-phosphopantetheinyl transferase superfamily protein, partial [Bacteroidales bacterium]